MKLKAGKKNLEKSFLNFGFRVHVDGGGNLTRNLLRIRKEGDCNAYQNLETLLEYSNVMILVAILNHVTEPLPPISPSQSTVMTKESWHYRLRAETRAVADTQLTEDESQAGY